ncbi:CD276 antigen homolog [Colossoma macropomum]|uniref:CD276 antigen homolog n=1 Tax=Colossoma macropomum TaxID=42526 RepID=UPI0018642BCD|nr:CD276 antigen homolog [Colossoma macropomum]
MDCRLGCWTGLKHLPVCVLLLLINTVSLQEIEAVVGDNIILPCSNSDEAPQDKVTVFWRFRDSRTVYDIINNKVLFDEQDTSFRHRVESFPAEWTKGNFSITLSSVQKADGGLYTCFIPAINKQTKVQLIVKDFPVSRRIQTLINQDVKSEPQNLLLFSAALLGLALLYV